MTDVATRLRDLAEKRVGGTLRRGKYKLDGVLGIGSMAAVYRATHRNGTKVAIKMLHASLVGDDIVHARFLREGVVANQVDHPDVVRVLDDDIDEDGTTFLVLELLEGWTLEDAREAGGGTLAPLELLEVMRDLLGILVAVHAAGVVHRDLKPENVFLTEGGYVKLLDLGIARMGASHLTVAGQTMGSPSYMAPEQAVGGGSNEVDARSDLYSVGAMVFNLLTGHPVHEGDTLFERLAAVATTPARSLHDVWADAPNELAHFVDKALAFDKADRWSSAEEMAHAVQDVYVAMGGDVDRTSTATSRRRRNLPILRSEFPPSPSGGVRIESFPPPPAAPRILRAHTAPDVAVRASEVITETEVRPVAGRARVAGVVVTAVVALMVFMVFARGGADSSRDPSSLETTPLRRPATPVPIQTASREEPSLPALVPVVAADAGRPVAHGNVTTSARVTSPASPRRPTTQPPVSADAAYNPLDHL